MGDSAGNAALFCDLGGTLVDLDETGELPRGEDGKIAVRLLPGVAEKLAPMRDHLILVVTNQSKIKRGRFTYDEVEDAIRELDAKLGDILTAWKICPHDDADRCGCRKPKAGMITELAEAFGVDLKSSTMVGDSAVDEQAALAAGVRFVHARDFFGWSREA